MFHRLVAPTYSGGLPGGYDYINDPAANGDAGVPAFADGKKSGGPNDGTWLVAFAEDATSENTNRGLQALAQNTDYIDDVLHKDLALTVRTNNATAVGAVASVVISGSVYVGAFGTTNNQEQRNRLISVVDSNDNEIIDTAGDTVQASLIHDGSSNNVLGVDADGFYTNPTISFSPAIPNGTVYRIYYGERSSLALLPTDAFTDVRIRGAQEVDGGVEKQLRDLHAPGAVQAWDAPFDSSIRALARAGLNERYRRSTLVVSGNYDTAGDGAAITRDGRAIELITPITSRTTSSISTPWPDPILACYRLTSATLAATDNGFPPPSRNVGGDIGLYQESDQSSTSAAGEWGRARTAGPLLFDVVPRDVRADTLDGSVTLTRISPVANATINPTSGSSTTARRTIQCAAGQYFRRTSAGSRTAIRLGIDMLEIQTNAGVPVGTYVITAFDSDTTVLVSTLSGGSPSFSSTADATVRIRWLQPTVSIGGAIAEGIVSAPEGAIRKLLVAQATPLSDEAGNNTHQIAALFLSAYASIADADPDGFLTDSQFFSGTTALAWGGAVKATGVSEMNGRLLGDGGIYTDGGRQLLNLVSRRQREEVVPANGGIYVINPLVDGSAFYFHNIANTFNVSATLTIQFAAAYLLRPGAGVGDELIFRFYFPSSVTPSRLTINMPSQFDYVNVADGAVDALSGVAVTHIDCMIVARGFGGNFNYPTNVRFVVDRTDYPP